ncbi:MAG: cell division protein SepF [Clostridia bacterium]|nr:cell division protein SepF [Clostridia bacterium]MBQ4099070.1 cell division protein SepF [Clostridia bacterium]
MGIFDFFSKKKTADKNVAQNKGQQNQNSGLYSQSSNIEIFKPRSFDDVAKIIDTLLSGRPAIVHLLEVRETTAQRVVDLLSGAVYAINGGVSELQKDIYIFTPNGVRTN